MTFFGVWPFVFVGLSIAGAFLFYAFGLGTSSRSLKHAKILVPILVGTLLFFTVIVLLNAAIKDFLLGGS